MSSKLWHRFKWPEGVPHAIKGYERPLHTIIGESAVKYPDGTYTIFAGATRTFAQVKETADRVANFLVSRGIKQGDRVAFFLPNIPHYPEIFFGILKAGGICVTCNPMYKVPELNFQLKDCGAKAVFGVEHLSRRTTQNVDVLLVVSDMSQVSLQAAARIFEGDRFADQGREVVSPADQQKPPHPDDCDRLFTHASSLGPKRS